MLIVNSGIAGVVWEIDYRDDRGLDILRGGNVGFGRYRADPIPDDIIQP
jgi:hypothetical protein